MVRHLKEGRIAVRQLTRLGVAAVLMVLAGSAALLAFAADAVDDLQVREERMLVTRNLDRFENQLVRDLTTATVWDQAYATLRPGGDMAWADAEIGSYYANNRGHDLTVVVDGQGRPFYAWAGEGRADPRAMGGFLADAQPLMKKVRAMERARRRAPVGAGDGDPALAETVSSLLRSGGEWYVVAASTVTPETPNAERHPGAGVVVISARKLDDLLEALNRELRVRDAALEAVAEPGENAIPLNDADGRPIGVLAWQAKRPGLAALRDAAPFVAAGLLLLLLTGAAVVWRVRGVVRRLKALEVEHDQATQDLVRARDEAEQANRAKSGFLANMSHEIRTPLNGILGMVQVMERSSPDPAQHERLQVIRDSGETLLAVLNGILDLSKIEAGRFELDEQDFDLAVAVGAACKPFANLAAQKDVVFEIAIAPQAEGVWRGDAMRLRQVLSNLAANAVKFTTAGKVGVEIARTDEGLSVAVADTGIGIAADRLSELFEKFVQADSSTTRKFGGTGLGLAISREFVAIMGGELTVESVEGVGSTFRFTLPLAKIEDAAALPLQEEEADAALPVRILAAEDSRANQMVLTALLEPLGVALHMACDGREAVEAFTTGTFDLVLMDVQMPVLNGIEATMEIRRLEAEEGRTPTPILALSANVMGHQVAEYLAAGMDGSVAKPIDAAALIEAIRVALERAAAAEAAA